MITEIVESPEKILVCPDTKAPLSRTDKFLSNSVTGKQYPIVNGIPVFFEDDKWNAQYQDNPIYQQVTPKVMPFEGYLAFCRDKLGGLFLDLGCGDGVYVSNLPESTTAYCVDVSLESLSTLKSRTKANLIPVAASGTSLPFCDNTFDTIFYLFVVEHLKPPVALDMMLECHRLLKSDGKVIYATDTPFYDTFIKPLVNFLLRFKLAAQDTDPDTGHINLLTPAESRRLVAEAGFTIVEEIPEWMGERFGLWNRVMGFFKKHCSAEFCEDYFTSKYTFVLEKTKAKS